ncbi:plasmid stabilization protein [Melittangium boletus]|uniref:plasmid stabilization protein n=1 Tax=Melittangium boletus TaxID=83453 RepID=UPI003DA32942
MPRGDKRKYTDKQKRKAEHIEEGYVKRGTSPKEAAARAWATVNAESHGGEKPGGSGYGQPETHQASRRGGRVSLGKRTPAQRSQAAKKAAATRKSKSIKRSQAAKRAAARRAPTKRAATRKRATTKRTSARKRS